MVTCPACGASNPPGSRFCNGCGAALEAAAPAPAREERRTVTVLFADLAGFTSRSESLDPEDVRAFLVPYYEVLTAQVTGHGGKVDRFLGDGIMAMFGAPTAHEDDPERAVRAALRIAERVPQLGLDLHVRVGVNTGEVLFVAAADGGRDDSVTGDAVNTAARLQAAAPTDGVIVGEPTWRATSHLFRYEPLDPIAAKGKAEPVPLWRPLAPLARRPGELHAETTPFVGRDLELRTLIDRFERSRSTPSLEVVTIVADPGLGKSRLVRELARYVNALPDLVTWRVGRCLPYGEGIGFWALSEIVAAQAGILETDDQVTLSAKLDAVLTEPDPSLRRWLTQRLAPLVGLETAAAPPQAEEAYTAWRRFLESIAAAGPLVLIVEDLHWADDGFVAFLQHLAANTAGLPLLLVVTARPEVEERHPSWLARARHSTVLSLDSLAERDLATLVAATLPGASPELLATVLERAAGSPLYAEQLAAMLRDRPDGTPLDEAAVPPTIHALLASRIDALPPDTRPALLDASVVGKTFWTGAVATLAGRDRSSVEPALSELARRELVRPVYPSSMEGEAEHAFWHALLRDVAYGELPRSARLARHRAAAAWIAERSGGARGRTAELVVAHLERALELAQATRATDELPALRDALADALLGAADHALATRPAAAPGFARRALELLGPDDARRSDALVMLGRALATASEFAAAAEAFDQADTLLRARGESLAAARLAPHRARAAGHAGDTDRAVAILEQARDALQATPGADLLAVLAEQAMLAARRDQLELAHELGDAIVRMADELGLPPPPAALMALGGDADMRRAIEIADASGDLDAASRGRYNLAVTRRAAEDWLRVVDESIAFDGAHGLPDWMSRQIRAWAQLFCIGRDVAIEPTQIELRDRAAAAGDRWNAALCDVELLALRLLRGEPAGSIDSLVDEWRATGLPEGGLAWARAEVALADGDLVAARAHLLAVIEACEGGEHIDAPHVLADMCLRAGDRDLAARAITAGRPGGTPAQTAPPDTRELENAADAAAAARLAEADGDLVAARATYEQVVRTYDEHGWAGVRPTTVRFWLGRCLLALGETEEGVARLREARAIWERLKATPRIAEIDALLATVE